MKDISLREVTATGHAKAAWHGRTSLTWDTVRKIREEYLQKTMTQRQLAKKYNTSQPTVYRIVLNQTWYDPNYVPLPDEGW